MPRVTAHEIDAEAARWAARADRGLSPEEEAAFQTWIEGDARHLGAYGRVRAVSLHTQRAKALGPQFDPAKFVSVSPKLTSNRRGILMGGGAIAASIAAVGIFGITLSQRSQHFTTLKGEVKVVALADGSVVTLNTASRIAVHLTPHRRDITLLSGEALFDVAHDKARPSVVTAGATQVRAVGTSFTVKHLDDAPVQVLVKEGVVEISRPHLGGAATPPLRLPANTRAIASSDQSEVVSRVVADPQLHRELAWREGRLAFEGETLAAAAKEFSRYSDTKIVVEDPAMAKEEIAGLFQANDPVGFAQAIATTLDGHAQVGAGEVRITR